MSTIDKSKTQKMLELIDGALHGTEFTVQEFGPIVLALAASAANWVAMSKEDWMAKASEEYDRWRAERNSMTAFKIAADQEASA
jgi:hypothetical protein